MNINSQLLFFFSALGVFNGLLLSGFLWKAGTSLKKPNEKLANWFLSLMLLMICIRIGKSVFFFFSPDLSLIYLQIGLSACFLIGPFLYFFICASFGELNTKLVRVQIGVLLTLILGIGLLYPYESHPELWRELIFKTVNLTWFIYLILSWQRTYQHVKLQTSDLKELMNQHLLELSVLAGNSLIWFSYYTSRYTSYIAGALSFSFITYLTLIVYFRQRNTLPPSTQQKYADKELDEQTITTLKDSLETLMTEQKLYTDANLTLPAVAKKLGTNVPVLSQFLNQNLNTPFTQYVNQFRIDEAKRLLLDNKSLSIESIAEQCGFNSQSTFYTAFKKLTDTTPAKFRQNPPDIESTARDFVQSEG